MQPQLNIDLRFTIDVPGGQCFQVFQYPVPAEPHIHLNKSTAGAGEVRSCFSNLHAAKGQAVPRMHSNTMYSSLGYYT